MEDGGHTLQLHSLGISAPTHPKFLIFLFWIGRGHKSVLSSATRLQDLGPALILWNLIGAKWFIKLFCVGYEIYKELCGRRLRPVCACAQVGQSLRWSSIRYKKRTVHSPRSQSTSRTYRSLIDQSNFSWVWLIGVCSRHPSLNPVNDSQIKDYPAAHFS